MSRSLCCLLLPVLLCGVALSKVEDISDYLLSGTVRFIDLSHPINNDTVFWPGNKKFTFTKKTAQRNQLGFWYAVNEFCSAEHGGTHLDAPYHFGPDKWTIGQIPFENLFSSLLIVDISKVVNGNPDFILEKHHMDNLLYLNPKKKYTILFKFGWSQYYSNPIKYLGSSFPTADNLNFPGIGEEVAKWISEFPNLVGVGVDTPSVDAGQSKTYPAHVEFSKNNIFNLENVNLDDTIPHNKCVLVAMPMKIQDGTGAPVRISAICPKMDLEL